MQIHINNAERLLIHRRRQGWDQQDAATYHDVSLYRYRAMEDGDGAAYVPLGHSLEDYEACFLLRLREEMTQADLADEMGLSVWWVCQMERGDQPADALIEHWAEVA